VLAHNAKVVVGADAVLEHFRVVGLVEAEAFESLSEFFHERVVLQSCSAFPTILALQVTLGILFLVKFTGRSELVFGTVATEVRIVRVLAGPTVGAKEVPIGVLERPVGAGVAVARLGVFTVLASPVQTKVTRVPAITGIRFLSVLVEGFEAATAIEAMGISALDSGNLAVFAEPAVGAGTILIIPVVTRPKVLVPSVFEFLDSQTALADPSQFRGFGGSVLVGGRPTAGEGAVRDRSPHKLAVGAPVADPAVARGEFSFKILLAGSLGGAVFVRILGTPDGPLDLAIFSVIGRPVVLCVLAVAKALGILDAVVGSVRQAIEAGAPVVAKVGIVVWSSIFVAAAEGILHQWADLVFAIAPESCKTLGTLTVPSLPACRLQEGQGRPVGFFRVEAKVVLPKLAHRAVRAVQGAFLGGGRSGDGSILGCAVFLRRHNERRRIEYPTTVRRQHENE